MAWIELIIGIMLVCVGILLMLGAANTPAPNDETNKYAIYGLIAGIVGLLLTVASIFQLVAKLVHLVAG